MNNLLHLKGVFEQKPRPNGMGPINLAIGKSVTVSHLEKLKMNLVELKEFWLNETIFPGALISVYYNKVVAKSNRIKKILHKDGTTPNNFVVGARFTNDNSPKHIITHYVPMELIDESINRLKICIDITNKEFDGIVTYDKIVQINEKKIPFHPKEIAKTSFFQVIIDASFIEKFAVLVDDVELTDASIITLYKTDIKTTKLMKEVGINIHFNRIMDETTIYLRPDEYVLLKQKAPYLISMVVSDIRQLTKVDFDFCNDSVMKIPSPRNEPIIGVIDTMFDGTVYFSEWVEFRNMLPEDVSLLPCDYDHGTSVSSIIVDGASFNPQMDDGCGRFRVKHFGVCAGDRFSSFTVLRYIEEIITSNSDIKVWNLSLGSRLEINPNFISPEAAILDKIQYENNVVFVIAGTNKSSEDTNPKAIGAPADSINSLVVNSVDFDNRPASYSRRGPVLSFFTKPDISYYGGDANKRIKVCSPTGESLVRGTSFAAPWISRKMSYLIDVLGLTREVAKALIVNSATGWDNQEVSSCLIGYGVVPIKIDDIVTSPKDEIRFILSGVSEKYDTYNFNIPVPKENNKHPFVAKATLCYFPYCSRNQGVDYTNTELEISFGRINDKLGITPINNDYQSSEKKFFIGEDDARKMFRKWDNVKHIQEVFTKRKREKMVFGYGLWGVSLKTKERLEKKYGEGIGFGIVVTLKEINGYNRIDDFIRNCFLRGWLVNKIEVENKLEIYNIAEEEIVF